MSLTSHLKDSKSPVYQFLCKDVFKDTKVVSKLFRDQVGCDVSKPAWDDTKGKYDYSLLGMAFDYRFRYYFGSGERFNLVAAKGISRVCDGPIAFTRVDENCGISHTHAGAGNARLSARYINSFFEYLENKLSTCKPVHRKLDLPEERILNKCCLVLGYFEAFCRNPYMEFDTSRLVKITRSTNVNDLLDLFEEPYVNDLCNLSYKAFDLYKNRFVTNNIILNPEFAGSSDIGGADADIIIDDCLVEIKTTLDANKNPGQIIRQLLGYVLLDYENEYGIRELEIFLPRQNSVVRLPLFDVIKWMKQDEKADLNVLRKEFKNLLNS